MWSIMELETGRVRAASREEWIGWSSDGAQGFLYTHRYDGHIGHYCYFSGKRPWPYVYAKHGMFRSLKRSQYDMAEGALHAFYSRL